MMNRVVGFLLISMFFSCNGPSEEEVKEVERETLIHSFAIPSEAVVKHLSLVASIDFENQVINANATYDIEAAQDAEKIVLDLRNLEIKSVSVDGVESKD